MIIVRMYQALGTLVVEGSAHVCHDGMGNLQEPRAAFLGRSTFDATGSLNAEDFSEGLYRVFSVADRSVAEDFGGWHNLL